MPVPVTIVDAFTDRPFGGNPAAVCRLDAPAPDAWMQAVAAEVNLSETAFVVPRDDGDHDLRWFTPTVELPLCGHATLASAHVLGGTAQFHTLSGLLSCTTAADGTIRLDLPATEVTPTDLGDWGTVAGVTEGRALAASVADGWLLLEVAGAADVRAARPDLVELAARHAELIVVAETSDDASEPTDSVARVFVPTFGIDEDPVTGAAHCLIGPWLAARTGRTTFTGHQASRRGGSIGMEVRGDGRVVVSGRAVTVLEGALRADPGT
ncbi:MAG TPA: PhzF family phenazine biosynthesis protein [Aquihabitans sp.]|jgi:predicted PhzF superfamily epimerase YddE/YHI9|nr:PhzF family phenazine biosynthesis protein [Aquihabitans sp.]